MRVLLAGPPKTGNVWVERMLASLYGLSQLDPRIAKTEGLIAWVDSGGFVDQSIFHQHFAPSDDIFRVAERAPCHLITPIRDPYDTFVSLFHYIQAFSSDFVASRDPGAAIVGKSIDDPAVLEFIELGFTPNLEVARLWVRHADKTVVVRYEDLHADPVGTLKALTTRIKPVRSSRRLRRAVDSARAEVMRKETQHLAGHIRTAAVGDWRNHLGAEHLAVFRRCHAAAIEELGYEVR